MNEKRKIADTKMDSKKKSPFIESDVKTVGKALWIERIIPSIKSAIYGLFTDGLSMLMFGNFRNKGSNYGGYTDYSGVSRPFASQISTASGTTIFSANQQQPQARPGYDFEKILWPTKDAAEDCVAQLNSLIETCGIAKVGDVYDFAGQPCTQSAWEVGWKEPIPCNVKFNGDGWLIGYPRITRV